MKSYKLLIGLPSTSVRTSPGFRPANAAGDPFGDKRVRQTVQRSHNRNVEEICEILLGEVSRFVGSAELEDDQTLVVARNLPSSGVSWSGS